jgi:regulator of protease activity HflC (stomatin/prohibitin superfamily)
MDDETRGNIRLAVYAIGIVIALVVIILLFPFTIIDAGERGVVIQLGKVNRVLAEGLHWRTPLIESVEKYDIQIRKIEANAIAYSKDIQTVDTTIALQYNIDANSVGILRKEIGADYKEKLIDPAIQESVKAATALFTAQELIEKRPQVRDAIKSQLSERLKGRYINVDDFSIVNFDFSDDYEQAVERKQVAQQKALEQENVTKQVEEQAKQRVASAKAEAEAIRIQAQAITQQGGEDYVNLKAIEKWDGKLPAQMIPNSSVPFLQLNK